MASQAHTWIEERRMRDVSYELVAALLYGFILFALCALTAVLAQGLWRPFDIQSYYSLADAAVQAAGPYLGASSIPSIRFTLPLSGLWPGLLIVGTLDLLCAVTIMKIGRKLYGREAGMLAGLLFTINIAWAQGYLTITEPLALLLILASAYALFCVDNDKRYIIAGFCMGTAVCLKPFALLLVPVGLYIVYKKSPEHLVDYLSGGVPAVVIVLGAAYLLSGGIGFPGISYFDDYRTSDGLILVADLVLSICMLVTLLPLAALGFLKSGRGSPETYFLLAGLIFICALAIGEYMNYWFIALPFLALLCACYRRPAHGG